MKLITVPVVFLSSRVSAGSSRFNVFGGTCTTACADLGLLCNASIITRLSSDK
jgi:hypothetical protein